MVSVDEPVTLVVEETVFGGPKNEVIDPFALGFLASFGGIVEALRLRDMMDVRGWVRMRCRKYTLTKIYMESSEGKVSFMGDLNIGFCQIYNGDSC